MRINQIDEKIRNTYLSFKLPLRIFAIIGVLYFSMSGFVFTYKAGGELWEFFRLGFLAPLRIGKVIIGIMGVLVALGTFVQIAPVVWDRLSHWGQDLDNQVIMYLFSKRYYLDEVEELLKKIRKKVNKINTLIHHINWQLITNINKYSINYASSQEKLREAIDTYLIEADKEYKQVVELLENNNAYDNINDKRDKKADEELNVLTIQLTDSFIKVQNLLKKITADCKKYMP